MLMLLRIDGCPLQEDELSFALKSWLSVLADTINSSFDAIELAFNPLTIVPMTAAKIAAASFTDGVIVYDSTNNEYVGQQSGSLVKFTTSPYP
jgi:hypothetical protein